MDDSKIMGVSLRGCITLILTLVVCTLAFKAVDVKEPLYSAFLLALGFYFGQKTGKPTNGEENK